jgi:hypothetical protein
MTRATLTQRVKVMEHKVDELATLPSRIGSVEQELKVFRADVHGEFAVVRAQIREGDEETRRYMRVLYEDLVARIKVMGEGIDELRGRR